VEVSGDAGQINNLTPRQKLDITVEVLDKISRTIISEKIEYEGTKEFKPYAVKEKIRNKTIELSIPEGEQERGIGQKEARNADLRLDLSDKDWYAFTENYGTSEEKALVKFINKTYDALKKRYDTIYLIRNERFFRLYNFSDGRPIEPDFVFILEKKEPSQSLHYQIFIEPKGEHLLLTDKWKEDFLVSMKDLAEIKILWQNKRFKVWGLPFYNEALTKAQFESAFNEQLAI
jgi:type III restriction enzyme